jgi:methionyl-tRNA synthetase
MKTFFISTSIPYVNAAPHIGHALEFAQADAVARFLRFRGGDVFFLTGTDDNALKNVQAAEAAGEPVQKFVDRHAETFKNLAAALLISNDDFIRTSRDGRHIRGAQKLWSACKKEDIYKKKYKGLYCLGCEEFKTPKDLTDGECPEHPGKKLETVEEENYFFKLSNYQKKLKQSLSSGELKIVPESRKNEMLAFVSEGLEDFSISRSAQRAKGWGVPVPGDPDQIMYVWFDALSNYINALGYADDDVKFQKYWTEAENVLHVIGKGINRFHTVYWPAMLLSAGLPLPKTVFVHGYLTVDGQKISKTLGNVFDPFEVVKKYGADATRYYLLREVSAYGDGDWSDAKFAERYNADLANGLGNLVARVFTLAEKHGDLPADLGKDVSEDVADAIVSARKKIFAAMEEFRFNDALSGLWELVSFADKYVNDRKPWAQTDNRTTLFNAIVLIDNLAALLTPFLPETAKKITENINWKDGKTLHVHKINNLFPRI